MSHDDHDSVDRIGNQSIPAQENRSLRWGSYLLTFAGLFTIAYGVLFLYRTYFTEGFEAGVDTLGGVTRAELAASNPEVLSYILHLHVNVAGAIMAVGAGIAILSWYGVRRGQWWAWATTILLPVIFLLLSLPVHQTVDFHFHSLIHLGPTAIGGPILVAGAVLSYQGLKSSEPTPSKRVPE